MYKSLFISSGFHIGIITLSIFTLPFLAKKPIDVLPLISVELIQISDTTNIPYAPKAAKIIDKVKKKNEKLLSDQAPPKKMKKEKIKETKLDKKKDNIKKDMVKKVDLDLQKDNIEKSKSKKTPTPENKEKILKKEKLEAIPMPDQKKEKTVTEEEKEQQPSKKIQKTIIEEEKKLKPEKELKNDEIIKELEKNKKPIKKDDNKVEQSSEIEKEELVDVDAVKGLIAKNYENFGEVKEKKDGITQFQDSSMNIQRLSATAEYALKAQIYTCWSVPTGLPFSEDLLVTVKLNLEKNGEIKNFEMMDHARMNTPGQREFRSMADSVIRAIRMCNPIKNLPTASYEKWKKMILRFNPVDMLGGQ